jgi:hypothetical protein
MSDWNYWVQKSNAGGRISKLFVEKKIFYSLHFFLVTTIKNRAHLFLLQPWKNNPGAAQAVKPKTSYRQWFQLIMLKYFLYLFIIRKIWCAH